MFSFLPQISDKKLSNKKKMINFVSLVKTALSITN